MSVLVWIFDKPTTGGTIGASALWIVLFDRPTRTPSIIPVETKAKPQIRVQRDIQSKNSNTLILGVIGCPQSVVIFIGWIGFIPLGVKTLL